MCAKYVYSYRTVMSPIISLYHIIIIIIIIIIVVAVIKPETCERDMESSCWSLTVESETVTTQHKAINVSK